MKNNSLKDKWQAVCDDYLRRFCKIMEKDYYDAYWPGRDVGSVVVFPDGESFGIHDIRYVVDNNIPGDTVWEWWYYSFDIYTLQEEYRQLEHYTELRSINLESWCKGAPRPYTDEEIKSRMEGIESIRKAKERFIQDIKELTNKE